MIQIENVSFGYSNENGALHNIDLTVNKGECILLCGESGCGKTTITKLVNGLIPHFTDKCVLSGKVTVNNVNVAETELYQLAITTGSVFQNPKSQFFNLDTDSELAFGLENEGVAPELIEKNVKAAVSSLKIENLLGRSIFSLSGGEKQILAFGSVLAMNTEILVLDEPTANLDTEGIIKLQDQIRKLKETGHTVIIAEHRLYFLEGLIDRAVFIKNGEIIKIYSGRDFFALSDDERIEMGLRTLKPELLSLPFVEKTITGKGLEVENLACRYKHNSYIIENFMLCMFAFTIFAGVENINDAAHVLSIVDTALNHLDDIEQSGAIDENGKPVTLTNYEIKFNNVTFGYDSRKIFENVSLCIPENTTTAIVGPSGGGKTTLCNLIARFYDVQGGSITIGGHNVKEFTCDSLLKNISMVFQNVYLFNDTVRNNIRFGKSDATDEEVIDAAKKACCYDFIMALPNGFDTVIGEGGSSLSGGEKQRISIARAILKDAPIIILDEATASIDPENEHLIQQAIGELTHGKTIITIAHRLATIENADQILVVANGGIAERGTHKELIAHEGIYKKFMTIRETAEGWRL